MNASMIIGFILFLPLIGGIVSFFSGIKTGWVASVFIAISFFLSLILTMIVDQPVFEKMEWMPGFQIGIYVDRFSTFLITLVTLTSLIVHFFSIRYMKGDPGGGRFFAKLGLFVFSMIGLLIADHFILLFIFWEIVGFSSYLLIGFWYQKEGVSSSARMAFMVNRVADIALLAGILLLYHQTGNLFISNVNGTFLTVPALLIVFGAFGKSAQLPFSGWLIKAMVGPTPVSALIHAATMVVAGVYLLFRLIPFLPPAVQLMVVVLGTVTALYGGLSAIHQHHIKKVLAYSTISQLGYMMIGIGVGAREASLFHLFTHSFFKAGLFLGAASIIHYMHQISLGNENAQDMRFMGGLQEQLPWTYRSFLICGAALVGLPLFSGFMSKDGIIIAAWLWAEKTGVWAYLVPSLALLIILPTAFYVGKMILLIFWGKSNISLRTSSIPEPVAFVTPLLILSIFSFWFCYSWNPLAHDSWMMRVWNGDVVHFHDYVSWVVPMLSLILGVVGLALSYLFFGPMRRQRSRIYSPWDGHQFIGGKLIFNGFYLIGSYQAIQRGVFILSSLIHMVDRRLIDTILHISAVGTVVVSKVITFVDRFIVDGLINWSPLFFSYIGRWFAGLSGRDSQTQLTWMLVGLILILGCVIFF